MGLFVILWVFFWAVNRSLSYVKIGSDVIYQAKLHLEQSGEVFPANSGATRVIIFGNSKILAGFIPAEFDRLAAANQLNVYSYNSGFPATEMFIPQLGWLCARGQAPDVLLLTLPWSVDGPPRTAFRFLPDDHTLAERFFPFRYLLRDVTSFLIQARSHGGIRNYYREAQGFEADLMANRGYHYITEQSRFPGGRIPDSFHLDSDQPNKVQRRNAPESSSSLTELNQLVQRNHIRCYYVPYYLRQGEAGQPPAIDQTFASLLERRTSCRQLGPDYFLYPNRMFSDQTHMNPIGAQLYTLDLFRLVQSALRIER